jgi:hypothetical protein
METESQLLEVISSGFCAFKGSREVIGRVFSEWQNSILQPLGASVVQRDVRGTPDELISTIFPLVSPVRTKHLFLELGSDWVVVVDNGYRGTDASLAPVLSRKCKCLAVRVVSKPHTFVKATGKGNYGAEIFESYEAGNALRTVFCANDGGKWKFGQTGPPYEVENLNNYSLKTVRERMKRTDLTVLLNYLGVNVFDPAWASGNRDATGTLYSRAGQFPSNYYEV